MGRPIETKEVLSAPVRLLLQRPEQVVRAWRRAMYARESERVVEGALQDVLSSFLQEIGAQLAGAAGSAWSRTSGVLRLSIRDGIGPIRDELAVLRRVLSTELEAMGASVKERLVVNAAIDQALSSTVLAYEHLLHPERPAQDLRFGGVVVERFRSGPIQLRQPIPGHDLGFDSPEREARAAVELD